MSNTFTNILPVLTESAQVVSREAVGIARAITLDTSDQGVNLGASINIPKAPAATAGTWTPAVVPTTGDTTATGIQLSMSTAKEVTWHVTAEQEAAMNRGNANAMRWMSQMSAQAFRTLANAFEAYLFALAYKGSSRAAGTAGTTPFASDLSAASAVGQILNENGAPMGDRSLIVNPAAYNNLQARFANVAASVPAAQRAFGDGDLPMIAGLMPRLSNQITQHTAGTATGYLLNDATPAIGDTSLTVDTGSGTILAGDVILGGTGGRYYVVDSALSGSTVGIGDPGIYGEALADNEVLSIVGNYTPNLALSRDAIYACVRAPLQPESPLFQQEIVVDPVSGIPFGVLRWAGDGLIHYSARIIYAGAVVEQGHIATLMG